MANTAAFLRVFFFSAPKQTWTPDDIPDLTGQVVLVTGGNTGIGKETAKALLAHNAKVYIACRSRAKAEQAIADLAQDVPANKAEFLELDLADLASVRRCAEEFLSKEQALHVLFNNGGVMNTPVADLTKDGYDLQFGTNVLGHFLLTQLLLPALLRASTPGKKARVVTLSSAAAYGNPKVDYETLRPQTGDAGVEKRRQALGPAGLYYQSKFGNVVFANELQRRHGDALVSTSLHPGVIFSELDRHSSALLKRFMLHPFSYPTPQGAVTQLFAGTAPEAEELGGKYLVPWARVGTTPVPADDANVAKELWAWLEAQVEGR